MPPRRTKERVLGSYAGDVIFPARHTPSIRVIAAVQPKSPMEPRCARRTGACSSRGASTSGPRLQTFSRSGILKCRPKLFNALWATFVVICEGALMSVASVRSGPSLAASIRAQWRVVVALTVREAVAHNTTKTLGFFWVIADPLILTSGVIVLWSLTRQGEGHQGVSPSTPSRSAPTPTSNFGG